MPFIPVANTARVCVKYTLHGEQICNIMWFESAAPFDAAELTSLCTAINSWVLGELLPIFSADLLFQGTEARAMDTSSSPGVEVPVTPAVAGGVGNAAVPGNVAVAVKFLTGLTGRSFRGRNYLGGIQESGVSGNAITTALQGLVLDAFAELITYVGGLAVEHVVASLYSGVDSAGKPIPRAAGVTTPVLSYDMDLNVDSMRKRLAGRGA